MATNKVFPDIFENKETAWRMQHGAGQTKSRFAHSICIKIANNMTTTLNLCRNFSRER